MKALGLILAGALSGVGFAVVHVPCMPLSLNTAFPSVGKDRPVRGFRLLAYVEYVALFVAEGSVSFPRSLFLHQNGRTLLLFAISSEAPKAWLACYIRLPETSFLLSRALRFLRFSV